MKTKKQILVALVITATSVFGQTSTTTWYGPNNNAVEAGVTADTYTAIADADWHDTTLDDAFPNGSAAGNSSTFQTRAPKTGLGQETQMVSAFRWDNLSVIDQISTAFLYLDVDLSANSPSTYYISPINSSFSWEENTVTWSSLQPNTDYNSTANAFSVSSPGWMSVDVTSLVKDYLAGSNAGFAIVKSDSSTISTYFTAFSSEDTNNLRTPGLFITTIPEPASAFLGVLGFISVLIFRRIQIKKQEEIINNNK